MFSKLSRALFVVVSAIGFVANAGATPKIGGVVVNDAYLSFYADSATVESSGPQSSTLVNQPAFDHSEMIEVWSAGTGSSGVGGIGEVDDVKIPWKVFGNDNYYPFDTTDNYEDWGTPADSPNCDGGGHSVAYCAIFNEFSNCANAYSGNTTAQTACHAWYLNVKDERDSAVEDAGIKPIFLSVEMIKRGFGTNYRYYNDIDGTLSRKMGAVAYSNYLAFLVELYGAKELNPLPETGIEPNDVHDNTAFYVELQAAYSLMLEKVKQIDSAIVVGPSFLYAGLGFVENAWTCGNFCKKSQVGKYHYIRIIMHDLFELNKAASVQFKLNLSYYPNGVFSGQGSYPIGDFVKGACHYNDGTPVPSCDDDYNVSQHLWPLIYSELPTIC